jgi:TRAP transporter TAXI family solute receptor
MRSPRRNRSSVWRRAAAVGGSASTLALALLACTLGVAQPDVVIGTGSPSGIYYPLGGSICRLFNLDTPRDGRRCIAAPSAGPVANIESLRDGRADIGIVPSDVLADAVGGQGPFASRGPDTGLRILFTGHADAFTIVARREVGIRSAAELRGRRINMGSPGSGERVGMERIMAALGVSRSDFAEVHELSLAEQHRALCANELDAIVYSVGHPNGLIQDVVRMCRGVLVDVSGPSIDAMLSRHREYHRAVIRGGTYLDNPTDVQTLGVRAVIVTTTRLSDALAYEITKAVFDNLDDFRHLHPLFAVLSVDDMVDVAGRAPIHTGAARYYRERGWTTAGQEPGSETARAMLRLTP